MMQQYYILGPVEVIRPPKAEGNNPESSGPPVHRYIARIREVVREGLLLWNFEDMRRELHLELAMQRDPDKFLDAMNAVHRQTGWFPIVTLEAEGLNEQLIEVLWSVTDLTE